MYLTQEQIETLKQNLRNKKIRIELLDYDLKTVDTIEGQVISGSLTSNADNDIRRSGNLEIAIPVNYGKISILEQVDGFTIEAGGKIWLDKYVKIYVGIENIFSETGEIVWYNRGVFLINNPTRTMNADTFSLSFECIDLMAKLTGSRQGQLTGLATTIEKGYYDEQGVYQKTKTRDALVSIITELAGITQYTIYPIPAKYEYLPYDIKVGIGATVYDLLKQIMDILSTWQMYFDNDGVFVIEPIPSGENGIVYDIDDEQYISDVMNCDFENVKNQVVIYGRLNTLTYYTENTDENQENVQYIDNSLILRYDAIKTNTLNIGATTFGFYSLDTPNTNLINNVKIYNGQNLLLDCELTKFENSKQSFGVSHETNQIEIGTFEPKQIYFIRIYSGTQIKSADDIEILDLNKPITFEFMGKQQVSYNLVNDNKKSPFYINNNLPLPNFYAGTSKTPSNNNWGEGYELTLNDSDEIVTSLAVGTIITFQANALNLYSKNTSYTAITVKSSNGEVLVSGAPLVQNKWQYNNNRPYRPYVLPSKIDNDYTIWMLRYEVNDGIGQFVLVGRNPSALTKVFEGGEYENIYADQLAYERCLWELFQHSNMNNSISIGVVPNYLIDVNYKIAYRHNNGLPINIYDSEPDFSLEDGSENYDQFVTALNNNFYVRKNKIDYYLVKQITYPLGVDSTAQTISAIQIYDDGNLVGNDYKK